MDERPSDLLPSWRDGAARTALRSFLDGVADVEPRRRLAVFDNDGTLWCERPEYVQARFLADELRRAADTDVSLAERPEYAALLGGDRDALAALGLDRVALALVELLEGLTPDEFDQRVRAHLHATSHPRFGRPLSATTYRPMLELIAALRRAGVTVALVSGGGTEYVRAVAPDLYGVPPELVVGTMIRYRLAEEGGAPVLRRTAELQGEVNEGPAKVAAIQAQLGRAPLLAAGNSPGDLAMLEYAAAQPGGLALVVDHDDATREVAYESEAASFAADEPLVATARRRGWVVASMRDDWREIWA